MLIQQAKLLIQTMESLSHSLYCCEVIALLEIGHVPHVIFWRTIGGFSSLIQVFAYLFLLTHLKVFPQLRPFGLVMRLILELAERHSLSLFLTGLGYLPNGRLQEPNLGFFFQGGAILPTLPIPCLWLLLNFIVYLIQFSYPQFIVFKTHLFSVKTKDSPSFQDFHF